MKRKFVYLLLAILVLLLIVTGLKLRHERQQALSQIAIPEQAPWAVNVANVIRGRATQGFPALAQVKGANDIAITPRIGGIILLMNFREGSRVKKGELLAKIDTRELQDQLASLLARRESAKTDAQRKQRDAQRAKDLLKKKGISESATDQLVSAAKSAQEQVQSLDSQIAASRTRLDYATIKAPFNGVISSRLADPGDYAATGKPLYRLVSTDGGRLEIRLPSEVLDQVHVGTEVVVSKKVNGRQQSLSLKADRVFPSLDQRALGHMEVDLDTLPFAAVPGALLRARVITRSIEKALIVPSDAVLTDTAPDGITEFSGKVLRLSSDRPPRIEIVPVAIQLNAEQGVVVSGQIQAGDKLVRAHETTLLHLKQGDAVLVEGGDK